MTVAGTAGRPRAAAKEAVEAALVGIGAARLARGADRSAARILAYHNVVPKGEMSGGDRSLHLAQARFAAQLDLLVRTHDVVPLEDVLTGNGTRRRRPRVAITFDDACRGAVTVGVEELAERGLPATIFVAPAFVGGRSFWWDDLAAPDGSGLGAEVRRRALDDFRGRDALIRDWADGAGLRQCTAPEHARAATEGELASAARQAGITFASHTWSHPNLARLDAAELADELVRPLEWLRARYANVIPWLSYPYGLFSPAVQQAAERAGYRAALRIDGGRVPREPRNPFTLPRMNVPAGLSANGFALRVSGVFR